MSKSLKNFITIRECLNSKGENASPISVAQDLRLFFLMHKYDSPLYFSREASLSEGEKYRNHIQQFIALIERIHQTDNQNKRNSVHDEMRSTIAPRNRKPTETCKAMMSMLNKCRYDVLDALANDFDTPTALKLIHQLIALASKPALAAITDRSMPTESLLAIADYIVNTMQKLGLDFSIKSSHISSSADSSNTSHYQVNMVDFIVSFRSSLRQAALLQLNNDKNKATTVSIQQTSAFPKQVLQLCDKARDSLASTFKIDVYDNKDSSSTWKVK